ncbi:hypothetical protein DFA_01004 [Cavenderia fasciculata]|uniref:Transmembrane protein n=1 Tax=Cavenderia fasciculata TaxID=261658 RepID=F4PV13_CACFS|nr:uncharacterized protein DFA_01004 [Cavenderia fasciculata]EGG21129.1 hypothetical protein DFA_01004 [Cavenderia fasciculata]|eukprot:XP_004358979.1 hypothetical protein DFA_01004 [Cavenderia fasciculata]
MVAPNSTLDNYDLSVQQQAEFLATGLKRKEEYKRWRSSSDQFEMTLFFIFGFFCQYLWLCGLFYVRSKNSKARLFACLSLGFLIVGFIAVVTMSMVVIWYNKSINN